MKLFHMNLPIGMTILLVILTILLSFILVPFLLVVVFCWFIRFILSGFSPLEHYYSNEKARRQVRICGGPDEQDPSRTDEVGSSASGDDTIECEVLSARTFDENGQEIR